MNTNEPSQEMENKEENVNKDNKDEKVEKVEKDDNLKMLELIDKVVFEKVKQRELDKIDEEFDEESNIKYTGSYKIVPNDTVLQFTMKCNFHDVRNNMDLSSLFDENIFTKKFSVSKLCKVLILEVSNGSLNEIVYENIYQSKDFVISFNFYSALQIPFKHDKMYIEERGKTIFYAYSRNTSDVDKYMKEIMRLCEKDDWLIKINQENKKDFILYKLIKPSYNLLKHKKVKEIMPNDKTELYELLCG